MTLARATYCLLFFLPFFATAQKANFQFYTTQDGLSGSFTHIVTQDKRGLLWVLNDYKLHRFDGYKFELDMPPPELAGSDERLTWGNIYNDSLLACMGDNHLFLLNTETGNWQSYPFPGEQKNGKGDWVLFSSLQNDWLILSSFNDAEKAFDFYNFDNGQFSPLIQSMQKATNDVLMFLGHDERIYVYPSPFLNQLNEFSQLEIWDPGTPSPKTFEIEQKSCLVKRIHPLKNGTLAILLWIKGDAPSPGFRNELYLMDPTTGKKMPHPANRFVKQVSEVLWNHLPLENGDHWLCGADRRLYFYDAKRDTMLDFSPALKELMPNINDILFGFEDSNGTVWFGTRLGLLKVSLQEPAFEHYFDKPDKICGGDCSFRGMTEDTEGNLYAGFYHGIVQFDSKLEKTVFFTPTVQQPLPFPSNLFADNYGLWLNNGTLMNVQTGAIQAIQGSSKSDLRECGFLSKDSEGTLWRLSPFDLFYLQNVNGRLKWEQVLDLPDKSNQYTTNALHLGQYTGYIYIGHTGKLLQFDPKSKKETWLDLGEKGIPNTRILAIEESSDGRIWLATDVGLVRYTPESSQVRLFTTEDGLPNNFVCGMLPEGDSCLWLSTNHGLSRFHIADESFINFFEEDGLTHNEFNRKSYFKAKDGRMFFGGLRGINAFYPDELMKNLHRENAAAKVNLSSFEYADEKQDTTIRLLHFPHQPTIHLYHHHRSFTFEYVLTDFRNPTEVTYSYQMEGYENVWSAPSKFNFTRFSSLPAGSYTFRVRAKDSHGIWHPNELAVTVIMHPPWWSTWWAYLSYLLVLGGIAFGIFSFLKKRWKLQNDLKLEQEEASRLKELDRFKSRLYTNLTHEFRTPLTVILGMTGQIKKNPEKYLENGTRLIESNGQNLLHLINQLLDLSKLENKSFQLHLQQGDIIPYLRYITESFQTYANSQNLSLRFFCTMEKLVMDFDPEQIKQVLTNLISNAMKFTPSGGEVQLRVTAASEETTLAISVADTGIGIPEKDLLHIFDRFYQVDGSHTREGEGTGIGLAHTLELVKLMGGDISVESKLGKGTVFLVQLPITRKAKLSTEHEKGEIEDKEFSPFTSDSTDHALFPVLDAELPTLLIIEDNPDVVVYLKSCLEGLYQLDVAYNGKIGIEKALEHIPDLIVSDVMMPEKDGFEVCDLLKNDERTSHIPIVLLTAKADAASKIAGLRRGADTYLAKPFDKEELLVWLEKLLERQQRMAAYFSKKIKGEEQPEPAIQEAVEVEDAFMQKVRKIVEENFSDEDFALPQLCQKIGMSRSQLFRKMKALMDESPSDFIRNYRLTEAKRLLETTDLNVSEVAWKVGYKYLAHFSTSYQEFFGEPPSATSK